MPNVQLAPLLKATEPQRLRSKLDDFFGPDSAHAPTIETTRLQPPVCYWAVYRSGTQRATLKCFFAGEQYERYTRRLERHFRDRIGEPRHPQGGLVFLPEINGVLWGFPFDPMMPGLARCIDGRWIASLAPELGVEPLEPRIVNYKPELGAIIAYAEPGRGQVLAYGKCAPSEVVSPVYLVMEKLWRSPSRVDGTLRLPRPLVFRPEAGLLLQEAAAGVPLSGPRNREAFLRLVENAGRALAAMHGTEIGFGKQRSLEERLQRVQTGLQDTVLFAPGVHRTLQRVANQLVSRAGRGEAEPPVLCHGDFKYDQLLEQDGQFTLIDFELFCRAEPAYDLGLFCAYLPNSSPADWRDAAATNALRAVFLHSYEERAGGPINRERLALHESAMLVLRALTALRRQQGDAQHRASQMLDLALDRLVNPDPATLPFSELVQHDEEADPR